MIFWLRCSHVEWHYSWDSSPATSLILPFPHHTEVPPSLFRLLLHRSGSAIQVLQRCKLSHWMRSCCCRWRLCLILSTQATLSQKFEREIVEETRNRWDWCIFYLLSLCLQSVWVVEEWPWSLQECEGDHSDHSIWWFWLEVKQHQFDKYLLLRSIHPVLSWRDENATSNSFPHIPQSPQQPPKAIPLSPPILLTYSLFKL